MAEIVPSNLLPGWRPMLIAMLILRETVRVGAYVSGLSILLWLIVDRSDRGLADLVFATVQGALASAVVMAAVSCWFAPADSWTRRRARTSCILIAALLTALILFGAGAREVFDRLSLDFGTRLTVVGIVLLSALVGFGVIGLAWLTVHEAIGRDCSDARLCRAARRLIVVWCLYWLVTISLILWISPFSETLSKWLSAALVIFETLYFCLVRDSCFSIRVNLGRDGSDVSRLERCAPIRRHRAI
jgi:hypothetical protein